MKTQRDRALLNLLRQQFPNQNPTKSFLKQEVVLRNQQNTYTVDFNDDNTQKLTERRLNRQDFFCASEFGIFLLREPANQLGTGVLQTFPNLTNFPAVAGFTPAHLELIYNAIMRVQIQNNVVYSALDTLRFRQVPQTFQSAVNSNSQFEYEYPFMELEPMLRLSGARKNTFTLEIPLITGVQIESVTAGTDNKLVFYAGGYLIEGGATEESNREKAMVRRRNTPALQQTNPS